MLKKTTMLIWKKSCTDCGQENNGCWEFKPKLSERCQYALDYFIWLGWIDEKSESQTEYIYNSTSEAEHYGINFPPKEDYREAAKLMTHAYCHLAVSE